MKTFKYQFLSAMVDGIPYFIDKSIPYSADAEEIVKSEAYNGEYEIYDDGIPELDNSTTDEVLNTLLGV